MPPFGRQFSIRAARPLPHPRPAQVQVDSTRSQEFLQRAPTNESSGSSTRRILEEHNKLGSSVASTSYTRHICLSSASIHSLALVAPFDRAFNRVHKLGIFLLMLGIDIVQCMIMYYLHYVTLDLLRSGAGCQCNAMLQWLCIFCFLIIVWQEISQTLDSIEFLLTNQEDDFLAVGRCTSCALEVDDAEDSSSDNEWSCCYGIELEGLEGEEPDWRLCGNSAAFRAYDRTMDERQLNGFRIGPMTCSWKIAISLCTAVPKLVIEGLLMYIGSMYIATSRDNEEVITSVVAVTFICTMDDQISTSFLPGKISDALHRTPVSWQPHSRLAWVWVRIRSDYRMYIDASLNLMISVMMFHLAAFHAQCTTTAPQLFGSAPKNETLI